MIREIKTMDEFNFIVKPAFIKIQPPVGGFDTETTGLNIMKDKPFMVQFGWLNEDFTTTVFNLNPGNEELLKEMTREMLIMGTQMRYFMAHNIKFDLHMLKNLGTPYPFDKVDYNKHELTDTMILARLVSSTDNEFQSMALKSLAKRYVASDADADEEKVKDEIDKINRAHRSVLNTALKPYKWTNAKINEIIDDPMKNYEDIPAEVRAVYEEWKLNYGEATYAHVDKEIMNAYAGNDIDIMLKLFVKFSPLVKARQQTETFHLENKCIIPFWEQERIGLKVDMDYMLKSRDLVRNYLQQKRIDLNKVFIENKDVLITSEDCPKVLMNATEVSAGQHAVLKYMFEKIWGVGIDKADKNVLNDVIRHPQIPQSAKDFAKTIKEIRTIEKWLSTYIVGIIKQVEEFGDGRHRASIQQAGTVSGRISSAMQQFPREPLLNDKGEELFHPRKMIIPDEGYKLFYLDESQHELRIQANWTHYIGNPDVNLSRAYIPYQMDDKEWHPTDLHALTAIHAFGEDAPNREDWKKLRSHGKTTNFASNYGTGEKGLQENPALKGEVSPEEITKLYQGFKKAYPGVTAYQKWVQQEITKNGYITNFYGRRYYVDSSSNAYKVANYLVQGTAADMFKNITAKIYEFLKPYKSKMVLEIHDEIQYLIHKDEEFLIPALQELQQPKLDWCIIPMVCDIEMTSTNWAEKDDYELDKTTLEELL